MNVRVIIDHTPNLLIRLHNRELYIFVADTRAIKDASELELVELPQQLVLKDIFSLASLGFGVQRTRLDAS